MAERPIELAVVGHTNAGKTSLLRTLTRRSDFGEVSDQPGTTRHVETVPLVIDGAPAVRFADTPGLEDPVALLELVQAIPQGLTPTYRVRAFLRRPEATGAFEQEAKVLRALLEADAALYVIDCREAVLPKYHCEIELLGACATPLLPVLNHLRAADSREADWRRALAEHGLHAQAGFDAVAPFVGAEVQLYRDLATLLGARRARLDRVADHLARQQAERRTAGLRTIADHLVGLAALRHTLERDEAEDAARRAAAVAAFRRSVAAEARRAADTLLAVHGFRPDEAELAELPGLAGRWEDDLFNPQVLQTAARQLGTGAVVGAAIGLGLDVALAGLSLGAATTLGATIGGLASQGFGVVGRTLANKVSGRQDLTLDDAVLLVLADRLLTLQAALERRGHATLTTLRAAPDADASADLHTDSGDGTEGPPPLVALLQALHPARGQPDWATGHSGRSARSADRREALVAVLLPVLARAQPQPDDPVRQLS
ncbi:GTPase/DUF3482 domain-containing protein [Ideonella sp. A 288]|uniref:GTPase/DUF3482 domain-containing protein n=1 Tax=Ideonella sp. A 288 TaxID=1962181 RepID=UPI000B4AA405|nr:GTPase/DUF3482 domain-containing protein [Ideonella sp. A 288]